MTSFLDKTMVFGPPKPPKVRQFAKKPASCLHLKMQTKGNFLLCLDCGAMQANGVWANPKDGENGAKVQRS